MKTKTRKRAQNNGKTFPWSGLLKEERKKKLELYECVDLDKTLSQFYAEVRKESGEDYEPDSLRVMEAALERHLKAKLYPKSIIKDRVIIIIVIIIIVIIIIAIIIIVIIIIIIIITIIIIIIIIIYCSSPTFSSCFGEQCMC